MLVKGMQAFIQRFLAVQTVEEEVEFIARTAAHDTVFFAALRKKAGGCAQVIITAGMTVLVVDLLECVEIEHQERGCLQIPLLH